GRPEVLSVVSATGGSEDELLAAAAAVERQSEHPIASAIVRAAEQRGLRIPAVTDFKAEPGKGISGVVNGRRVTLGSAAMTGGSGIVEGSIAAQESQLLSQGATIVYVSSNDALLGIIAVTDKIKESTPHAVKLLHDEGLKLVMLTGDNQSAAKRVAESLHIDEYHANHLPAQKLESVKQLQRNGIVAMAGDGINDA